MSGKSPYKDTLFLPQTAFAMKAQLTEREPQMLATWKSLNLYTSMQNLRQNASPFVLHDGPPYANGSIHHGHCLNKILKDICVKLKHFEGFRIHFTPGWDCHGLPIEHEVEKHEGISVLNSERPVIRKHCRAYATQFVALQKSQFERLGVIADFDHSYTTMSPDYEAKDLEILAHFLDKNMVYRQKKPVHWSTGAQTSLAGSEIEYRDMQNPAIYVICPVSPENSHAKEHLKNTAMVFWTTTPWSIPAVLALSVHARSSYGAYATSKGTLIIATDCVARVARDANIAISSPLWTLSGEELTHSLFTNPITQKPMPTLPGEHVTMDVGTGVVSTAPGHGEDDYRVGMANNLPIYCPIGPDGRFTSEVPQYAGMHAFAANPKIIADLVTHNALLSQSTVTHSYPHCWRTKKPAILRATEQWFIDVHNSGLSEYALSMIQNVRWVPKSSLVRMENMLKHRPDWCISRQRAWGVPIPSVVCDDCAKESLTAEICRSVGEKFATQSADVWDEAALSELLPATLCRCPACGSSRVRKGNNILDVWFDSGISFSAVIKGEVPQADLYLEGNDQFRGWYQASLLTSYGYQDRQPYKAVLTHGMILDEAGHKFSKSSKNYEPSDQFVTKRGADVMRLWVASENFQEDMTFSLENIARVEDAYRKLRNTFRFMLGFLSHSNDYSRAPKVTHPLHQFVLSETEQWLSRMQTAYSEYAFNAVFREMTQFFTVTLSNFYFDILKDTLYCDSEDTAFRKEAVDVLGFITYWASHMLAPICSFLAEDIYTHLATAPKAKSIFLSPHTWADRPSVSPSRDIDFSAILAMRDQVLVACEKLRNAKEIQTNTEAAVTISGTIPPVIQATSAQDLALYWNVADVILRPTAETEIQVHAQKSPYAKCARCWRYLSTVGTHPSHPDLCTRCAHVIPGMSGLFQPKIK